MGRMKQGFAVLAAAAVALTTSAIAQEVEREGVIISRTDNNLNVRTREGNVTVVITPETTIRERQNAFNRERRESNTLIPGLIITVEGDQQGDTLTAERIQFRERDWRSAIATRAGTTEQFEQQTQQISELRRAIVEGQEYDIRGETTVYFATGSATVAAQYHQALRQLAQQAPSFGNYRVSILGYADSRGNPEANERLSLRRSMAVSNFLRQTGLIQPGRVLSPTAMGEGNLAPGDTAPRTDDEARRVVVRVITPRGQLTP
jgi:outer membrane protein OmpA-like peptidoglycan-associated protein